MTKYFFLTDSLVGDDFPLSELISSQIIVIPTFCNEKHSQRLDKSLSLYTIDAFSA